MIAALPLCSVAPAAQIAPIAICEDASPTDLLCKTKDGMMQETCLLNASMHTSIMCLQCVSWNCWSYHVQRLLISTCCARTAV